ncbi:MAG: hypothetical protein KBS54_01625 [Synergistaceae bacterium]|nr:hypothetical protein [Candidatus Equadaptatus faecalis]
MSINELKPTTENIAECFVKDIVRRQEAVLGFVDVLDATSKHSIAVDGRWGSGKTFFVKQTKLLLDICNKQVSKVELSENILFDLNGVIYKHCHPNPGIVDAEWKPMFSVYYDAWTNDNDIDPLISIIYCIAKGINEENCLKTTQVNYLRSAADIIKCVQGWSVGELLNVFNTEDPLSAIKSQKSLEERINEFLGIITNERGEKIVIFIDELDRCKPSFAVKLLERVKHYFDNERVIFVFSTNLEQLQHTVKKFYGIDFDATRYLNRFFDYVFELPEADMENYLYTLQREVKYDYDFIGSEIMKMYNLTLRDVAQYYRMLKFAFDPAQLKTGLKPWAEKKTVRMAVSVFLPILFVLRMTDNSAYNDFINGKSAEYFEKLICSKKLKSRARTIFCAGSMGNDSDEDLKNIVRDVYSAVFIERYEDIKEQYLTNSFVFTQNTKECIFDIISGLSLDKNIALLE